ARRPIEYVDALRNRLAELRAQRCGMLRKPARGVVGTNDPCRSVMDGFARQLLALAVLQVARQEGASRRAQRTVAGRSQRPTGEDGRGLRGDRGEERDVEIEADLVRLQRGQVHPHKLLQVHSQSNGGSWVVAARKISYRAILAARRRVRGHTGL